MVFYVGSYEIVVTIQNGCDNINGTVEVLQGGSPITAPVTASAVGIINPPVYAPAPENDSTPDCALELEFPISSLPDLDTNMDGNLLDESFATNFATRQSGGVGNDNDTNDNNGLIPTAVSVADLQVSPVNQTLTPIVLAVALILLLLISMWFFSLRKRA